MWCLEYNGALRVPISETLEIEFWAADEPETVIRLQMDSESKRPAVAEDRISALPDAILCHILSFLQQEFLPLRKCAVSTSILSKRWKKMWACLPKLYFYNHDFPSSADFIDFVDRALQIRDSSTIQKIILHFDGCRADDFSHINDWISTAIKCNLVELDLSVEVHEEEMFELPESLLTCETILVWKLWLNYSVRIPKGGCYRSLKELHLKLMHPSLFYPENNLMDFSQFPVLEYLGIDGYFGHKSLTFIISGPELKTLRIWSKRENNIHVAHIFYVNAPKLEKLDVEDDLLSYYTLVNTRSLVEANVRSYTERATKFLAGISRIKCLTISSHFLEACSFAVFDNLRELKVVLQLGDCHKWSLLTKVLGRMSNLESFVVEYDGYMPPCHIRDSALVIKLPWIKEDNEVFADRLLWSPPESVPNCLIKHVKTICVKGFKGSEFYGYQDEKEAIKYLLRSSQVLQKMTIDAPGLSEVEEKQLNNELSVLEWGSKSCRLEVKTEVVCRCRS